METFTLFITASSHSSKPRPAQSCRGQITLQGLIEIQGEDDPGPFTVAITGGTGAYRGAGGTAVVREVRPGVSVYKLRLDLPKKHSRGHHKR